MREPLGVDCVHVSDAVHPSPRRSASPSRRLLRLVGDERLVQQIRQGSEAAFEVAFERHAGALLGFCRHMLGSAEDAEEAVQHTFAAAYGDLQRDPTRQISLRPWLFAIARNRCVSILRGRTEHVGEVEESTSVGLAEQVEQRAELRELLADVRELPLEQRAALLLAELGDLSHAQIADVLDCEAPRVRALVHRARASLIARREAREVPCDEIREQLANLRGGSLRRLELRFHLRDCAGCRQFREQLKRQRQMLAAALPVAPTAGLKTSVLAAVGIGGGSAGGAAAGLGAGSLSGLLGGAGATKLAVIGALAGGGVAGGAAVVAHDRAEAPVARSAAPVTAPAPAAAARPEHTTLVRPREGRRDHGHGVPSRRVDTPSVARSRGVETQATPAERPGPAHTGGGSEQGAERHSEKGRGQALGQTRATSPHREGPQRPTHAQGRARQAPKAPKAPKAPGGPNHTRPGGKPSKPESPPQSQAHSTHPAPGAGDAPGAGEHGQAPKAKEEGRRARGAAGR
jgi:RNA polymerase sigma factor (sigma-70 family)